MIRYQIVKRERWWVHCYEDGEALWGEQFNSWDDALQIVKYLLRRDRRREARSFKEQT